MEGPWSEVGRDGLTRRSREKLPGRQLEKPKLVCSWVGGIDFLPFCLYGCQVLLPHSHLLYCKDTTDSARALHRKPTWPLSSVCSFSPYTSFSSAAPFLPKPLLHSVCTSKFSLFTVPCDFVGPLLGYLTAERCSSPAPRCPGGCQDSANPPRENKKATHRMSAWQQEQIAVLTWHGWAQMPLPATLRQSPAMLWGTNHTLSRHFGILQRCIFADGQIYFRGENACGEPNFSRVL